MILKPNVLFHDRYRLIEMKGRGAFGEVWLAYDTQLDDMKVAIKIYIALDTRGKEEFKGEYVTAFNLNHPNLLHAYHFDVFEDRPYLVMPYCPQSSTNLVGKIEEPVMWQFIYDTASGLSYLHEKDILHRDIKPDNILIDESGKFLITDFGISVSFRSTLRQNSSDIKNNTDSIGGAIPYMAPELFGEDAEAVKASDIWALGVTLFELSTGELPFFGNGGILQKTGAKIPKIKADYSDALKDVIKQCLAVNGWDRPNAAELVEIAREHLKGKRGGTKAVDGEEKTNVVGNDEGMDVSSNKMSQPSKKHHNDHTPSTDESQIVKDVGSVRLSDLVMEEDNQREDGDVTLTDDEVKQDESNVVGKAHTKSKALLIVVIACAVLGVGGYFIHKYIFDNGGGGIVIHKEKTVRIADSLLRIEKNAKEGLDMLQELAKEGTEMAEAGFLLSRIYFDPSAANGKGTEFYSQDWETMRKNCGLMADNTKAHEHLMKAFTLKAPNELDEAVLYELGCDFLYGRGVGKDWGKARWCFEQAKMCIKGSNSRYEPEIQKKLVATSDSHPVKP